MIITIITFIVLLQLLVFVHEWGHFVVAKKSGVKVEEFGFGLPPRLFGWKKGEVIYSINWLPLGGFVRLKGEDGQTQDSDSFIFQPWWRRLAIVSAGVCMNIVFAWLALTLAFMLGYPVTIDPQTKFDTTRLTNRALIVTEVLADSPAEQAQLRVGDRIIAIDGSVVTTLAEAQEKIRASEQVSLKVKHARSEQVITIRPRLIAGFEQPALGVALEEIALQRWPFFSAIGKGTAETGRLISRIVEALGAIAVDLWQRQTISQDIGGPVAIAVLTNRVLDLGLTYFLQFAAVISLNFALINFLPFPALDGGRVLFLLLERWRGRAVNLRIEQWAHQAGFMLLIALALLITWRDLARFQVVEWFAKFL